MPILQITDINLTTLQAMLAFVSEDETRYVLNGVFIECHRGEPARLVATDGRQLLAHVTDWPHNAEADSSFIFPAEVLRAIAARDRRGGQPSILFDAETQAIQLMMAEQWDGFSIHCKAIDGNFPNWRCVLPSPMPENFPAKRLALNGQFFAELVLTLEKLNPKDNAVTFAGTEEDGPLVATTQRTTALLMPMR